jgi:lipoic acid synthetase
MVEPLRVKEFPPWLRKPWPLKADARALRVLDGLRLNTVCRSAECPNHGECWARGTATFLILGDTCTRGCGFCAVRRGAGAPLAELADEPQRIARAAKELGLKHVVVTSVTRDDLPDEGAGHFAAVIRALRTENSKFETRNSKETANGETGNSTALPLPPPARGGGNNGDAPARGGGAYPNPEPRNPKPEAAGATAGRDGQELIIEVLVPDFHAREECIRAVVDAAPHVFNHNLETVERLYPSVRPQGDYRRALAVLATAKRLKPELTTKSGLMVGLGESADEVRAAVRDLRNAGCDILTIGQYLAPSAAHVPVARFVPPEEFKSYEEHATSLGFSAAACGPFVRSSYQAEQVFQNARGV